MANLPTTTVRKSETEKSASAPAPSAIARARNLSISTKHATMVCHSIRYKDTAVAKKFLLDVMAYRKAVPYLRFNFDLGHKPGMGPGRYPVKAAKEILKLIKHVEANAQMKGLNTARLKITKLMANKASIPQGGGRVPGVGKSSNLDIEVKERRGETKVEVRQKRFLQKAAAGEKVSAQKMVAEQQKK